MNPGNPAIAFGPFKMRRRVMTDYCGPAMYFQDGNSIKFEERYNQYIRWLREGTQTTPIRIYIVQERQPDLRALG
jgi:hypothetical protein